MNYKVEKAFELRSILAEGPFWDADHNCLHWVDVLGKKVNTFDYDAHELSQIDLPECVGVAIPDVEGCFIIGMESGLYRYNTTNEELTKIHDPEEDKPNNRFNDGKCDTRGRLWVGTMSMQRERRQGALYRLDNDEELTKQVDQVSISNGIAWSVDNKYMYYIDTPTRCIQSFHFDVDLGTIEFEKNAFEIPEGMGNPDGMTIDVEGNLWIAHWGGACITRWEPRAGKLLQSIEVPAKNVTSCTFGGKDLDILFITTAKDGLTEEEAKQYPDSGCLFTLQTNTSGAPAYKYHKCT